MARGGCRKCGRRTTNNRLCNQCQRLEDRGFFSSDGRETNPREVRYECTACGNEYSGTLSTECPECGETNCRAAESQVVA